MFLISGVDFVAPLARLIVQILPTGERSARQKVALDKPEGPFYARRAVGIAPLMCHEAKPEAVRERLHLRHRNHLAPRAPQHHHVRVIDHHALDYAARMPQRVGEKYLAVESVKRRIDLEEQHPRVAQDTRGGLRLVLPAAHFDRVWRRVVLHLYTRFEVILARRFDRRLPDALPPAE